MTAERSLAVLNVINPETGEVDLLGTVLYLIRQLNEVYKSEALNEPDSEGVFLNLRGGMSERFRKLGITEACRPDLMKIMQDIGVIRYYGKKSSITWQVVKTIYLPEYVTEEILNATVNRFRAYDRNRRRTNNLLYGTKKGREGTAKDNSGIVSEKMLSRIAILAAEIKTLREDLHKKTVEVGVLHQQIQDKNNEIERLKDQPQQDVEAIAEAMIKKALRDRSK